MFNFYGSQPTATKCCRFFLSILATTLLLNAAIVKADTSDDLAVMPLNKSELTEAVNANSQKNQSLNLNLAKEKSKNAVTAFYADGITLQTADKENMLAINGRVQFDSRHFGGKAAQNTDAFNIRRAYLTARGTIKKDYDFNVTADFTQQTNVLDLAYFGINWFNQAKIRVGQFDMPFGLQHLTSDLFLEFQERSFNDYLSPGKERGVMLHGAPIKGVYYNLAASTGRGKNVGNQDNNIDDLDMIARLSTNLAEVFGQNNSVFHIGVDYANGDVSPNQAAGSSQLTAGGFTAPNLSTEGRGLAFFTPGKFSTAFTNNPIERTRYGLEAAYASGPFQIQSERFKQNYTGINSANIAFDKDLTAWYISAFWMITGENLPATYQPNGTWGRVTPKHDFLPTGTDTSFGTGAWGIGLRYSEFNADDFDAGNGPGEITAGNATTHAQAWTAGVRWMLNSHTHLVANYVTTHFDDSLNIKNSAGHIVGSTHHENALTFRAQVDF